MDNLTSKDLTDLFLNKTPLIDVRAPVEFATGTLPGAVNMPIMDDEQRALVGTTYKQKGRDVAIELGHDLVSGVVKELRVQQWTDFIRRQPSAVLFCFRGGLRSQITQRWVSEAGIQRPLIQGGYKAARQWLREEIDKFSEERSMYMLSGPTGSAKTHLLAKADEYYPTLDLEKIARHRGSAFGALDVFQPTQIDFENTLAVETLRVRTRAPEKPILVEDESRLIGRCAIPERFFFKMRASSLLYVDETFEQRVENIFSDYILNTPIGKGELAGAATQFAKYRQATEAISRKLGGQRTQEVMQDLTEAQCRFETRPDDLEMNKAWIAKLLTYYYDPLYAQSFARRAPVVIFKAPSSEILEFLRG